MFEYMSSTEEKLTDIFLEKKLKELIFNRIDVLYFVGHKPEDLCTELFKMIQPIRDFVQKHMSNTSFL